MDECLETWLRERADARNGNESSVDPPECGKTENLRSIVPKMIT